ncbi:hypothetical protein [Chitinophaga pinensis]|uniref:Uncharacterized protein n=1 Tax=Chitinophaga pinensis (strain ATCC 43595 / DSM 2588 / LMG 13176 / NBRC 15968 / NCIMB 11800 / UQM 2034) TaxID=485918 RepID=A0A979FZZ3_CHIPD|nr:hypothetical protein [Chitinophaga pinensis]ACU58187.1 hypothetical protein Cpin_0689 [Chitinophaga pinensis DSM 2588]
MFRYLLTVVLVIASATAGFSQKGLYDASQEWPVKIDDGWFTARTLTFGPYSTSSRKNGIDRNIDLSFIKSPQHAFNIRVKGQEQDILIQVAQAAHIAFSGLSLPSFLDKMPATALFSYIGINAAKNEPLKQWQLILKDMNYLELNDNKPAGVLRSPETELRVTANNRFGAHNSYENICYEFHLRKQVVAAVVTGEHPRVWMSADIERNALQPILAAAIGALLVR